MNMWEMGQFALSMLIPLAIAMLILLVAIVFGRRKQREGVSPAAERTPKTARAGRLSTLYRNDGGFFEPRREVLVDNETGVQYLMVSTNYGTSVTPLLDRDGRPFCGR